MNRNQFVSTPHAVFNENVFVAPATPEKKNHVFDLIFSVDPATGLPRNDEQVFLSDKTSPAVKEYIAANLRSDNVPKVSALEGIPDADVALLCRNSGETRVEYATRIKEYLDGISADVSYNLRRVVSKSPSEPKSE